MPIKDLKSKKFDRLYVREFAYTKNGNAYWVCDCDCGTKDVIVNSHELLTKNKRSCGCLQKEVNKAVGSKNFETAKKYMNVQGTDINKIIAGNRSDNKSGVRGVHYRQKDNAWEAKIFFKGKSYYLLQSKDKEKAIAARKAAEKEIYGDFLQWYKETYPDKWAKLNKNKD